MINAVADSGDACPSYTLYWLHDKSLMKHQIVEFGEYNV